jgi:hypothetical protein
MYERSGKERKKKEINKCLKQRQGKKNKAHG